jgi:FemAB-related protein (PEP-CTERM system-associated)
MLSAGRDRATVSVDTQNQADATQVADIKVSLADESDRDAWNAYANNARVSEAYHLYDWRDIFENVFGNDTYYLVARDSCGSVCGLLPLVHLKSWIFGSFLVSVPCFNYCGILADSHDVATSLAEAAAALASDIGAKHVEMRHRDNVRLDLPFRDDKVSMQLELPDSEDDLWSSFSSKLRAQIRRPTKEGAVCVEGGTELVGDFYQVFSRNMRDLGTPVFPRKMFEQMCERFPDTTRVFVVRLDGLCVAAGITLGYRDLLEIPSASSLREFNRYSVNMLLYWSVLKHGIEQGYRRFDFGRCAIDSGPFRFKKQWGAQPQSLHWHYCLLEDQELPRLNPDNPRFHLATRIWRHLPLIIANFLGPRIVRNLP